MEHLKNIWAILEDTPGFDGMKILQLLPELLTKAARLIRNILLEKNLPQNGTYNGTYNGSRKKEQLALPPAAAIR